MSAEDSSREGPVGAAPAADRIVAAFARMSGLFLTDETVGVALRMITAVAVETVPGSAGAGITLLSRSGERETAAATSEVVGRADALQYELNGGPCLDAWGDRVPLRVDDLTTERRWPAWSARAAELGLRSSLSAPLVAGHRCLGAIKLYATEPGAYDRRAEHLLTMFASQAAMLLAHTTAAADAEKLSARITETLRGREVIAVARGILMARDGVDERSAFRTLAETARRQRISVRQAAERLTAATPQRRR